MAILPALAMADGANPPGIVTSISRTATIPTAGMPERSELWALWVPLPGGRKIEVKEAKVQGTWMNLDMGLTGSTVSAALPGKAPANNCTVFSARGHVAYTGQEITTGQGEGFACRFGTGDPYWEENKGTDLFSRAQLNVGGPWVPGMHDTVDAYKTAGGEPKAMRVDPILFRKAGAEMRAAGMMTATIRVVTMPPGSSSLALDRYPTLRMVTRGELTWGAIPVEVDPFAMPKNVFKLGPFSWVDWTRPQRVVLSNQTEEPAEVVEWTVAPAPGAGP